MTLPSYTASGRKDVGLDVDSHIFEIPKINHQLMKLAYEHYLSNRRLNLAKTKTRGLVSGGGKKPWRQKGLGRARVSSIRSPIWRGGGVVFGPSGQRNYSKKLNKKAKNLALKQALSLKNECILSLKTLPTDGKTATFAKLIFEKLKLNRRILIIDFDLNMATKLAVRNLKDVNLINVKSLNVFQILNADWLILTPPALKALTIKFDQKNNKQVKLAKS